MLYRNLIKPILFSLEPEVAHDIGAKALQITGSVKPITTCLRKLFFGGSFLKTSIFITPILFSSTIFNSSSKSL